MGQLPVFLLYGPYFWVVTLCQLQCIGTLFNLGVGYQKWKSLDIPGTQPPLHVSDAVVYINEMIK